MTAESVPRSQAVAAVVRGGGRARDQPGHSIRLTDGCPWLPPSIEHTAALCCTLPRRPIRPLQPVPPAAAASRQPPAAGPGRAGVVMHETLVERLRLTLLLRLRRGWGQG